MSFKPTFRLLPLFVLILAGASTLSAADQKVDVSSSFTGGTYTAPILVELKATQPEAKIWYSYNPNGGPGDAFLYTGALLLKKTTPLVFFAVVDYQNDSKIKINNYVFDYPSEVKFSSEEILRLSDSLGMIRIINTSSGAIDLGYWQVKTQDETITIPEETLVEAGSGYTLPKIKYSGAGVLTLSSPDEEEKAVYEVPSMSEVQAVEAPKVATPKPTPIVPPSRPAQAPQPAVENTPAETPADTTSTPSTPETPQTPVAETPAPTTPTEEAPVVEAPAQPETVTPTENQTPTTPSLEDTLKSSAADANTSSQLPLYILLWALLVIAVRGAMWYMQFSTKKAIKVKK